MQKRLQILGVTFVALCLALGCNAPKHAEHEDHKGHSDAEHASEAKEVHAEHAGEAPDAHAGEAPDAHAGEAPDAHAGEAPDAHAGEAPDAHAGEAPDAHAGHAGEGEIVLTPDAMKMAGITLAKADSGRIGIVLDLSGEVAFNEDRLVHITPRFPGIAKEARFRLGDFVSAGEVVAIVESNQSMTPYSLKAPLSGRIIQKHITPGEHVSESESIYMLADLSTVWVNLAVYPKDASRVKAGLKVTIAAVGSDLVTEGTIQYVNPVMDVQTRRITARVVLANGGSNWRPGTFVNAHVAVGEGEAGLLVAKEAVQLLNGETVVFIQHEPNTFKPVDVTVGESDQQRIRIVSGLHAGVEYVVAGAFELKAKIVTSSLGGHAGHGH